MVRSHWKKSWAAHAHTSARDSLRCVEKISSAWSRLILKCRALIGDFCNHDKTRQKFVVN